MSDNYVFRAELYNLGHPEYGVVTVPFPISKEEYGHILELLEPLEIGDPVQRDCGVAELDSHYTVLKWMKTPVNLDELDYLAKRLDSFDGHEAAQFQAMAAKLNLTDMTDLINLTFCCQQATVITDFSNLEEIGKDHYMTIMGGCCPTKDLDELDGVETAMLLISDNKGEITPYGVVYDNGMKLEQIYNGVQFPVYLYERAEMILEVPTGVPAASTWLYLPMPECQINRLLQRAGLPGTDAEYVIEDNSLPPGAAAIAEDANVSIMELNRMCQAITALDHGERVKLDAVIEMACPEYPEQIVHLAENLEQFSFAPGISTPEEYGRYMIQQSGQFEYDENLIEFYDYAKYGQQRIAQDEGVFTKQGYLAYHGMLSLDELMMEDPAEQHQIGQDFQMGGMTI